MDNSDVRGNSSGIGGSGTESSGLLYRQVRSSPGADQHFCSIKYVDEEGDQVIRHAFLTVEEQKAVVAEFVRRGIVGEINDLTPPAVNSMDDDA